MVFRGNGGVSVVANIVQRKYNIKLSVNMGGGGVGGRSIKILKCLLSFTPLSDKSS